MENPETTDMKSNLHQYSSAITDGVAIIIQKYRELNDFADDRIIDVITPVIVSGIFKIIHNYITLDGKETHNKVTGLCQRIAGNMDIKLSLFLTQYYYIITAPEYMPDNAIDSCGPLFEYMSRSTRSKIYDAIIMAKYNL